MKKSTVGTVLITAVVLAFLWFAVASAADWAPFDNDDSTSVTIDNGGTITNSGNTGGDTGIATSEACVTTQSAKDALGLDVQRLGLESCGWVFRSVGVGTASATCPSGWVCTLHLANNEINVYIGDGKSYTIVAGTFRMINAYPANDAVHENPPCQLLHKEKNFGQVEDPSFPVNGGNFTCGGSSSSGSSNSSTQQASTSTCPSGTTALNDGNNGCKYGPTGQNAPFNVPAGWTADYWDGSATQHVTGPTTIMTGEASLYPAK